MEGSIIRETYFHLREDRIILPCWSFKVLLNITIYICMYMCYACMCIHKIKNLNFSSLKFVASCHSFCLRIAIAKRLLNTKSVLFYLFRDCITMYVNQSLKAIAGVHKQIWIKDLEIVHNIASPFSFCIFMQIATACCDKSTIIRIPWL